MAKYRVTSPSGEVFEVTAPDDAPPEAVMDYARKQWSAQSVPQGPTPQQRSDASVGSRFMAGQMDPFVGGAQLMANALPQPVADAIGGAFGNQPVTADQVNRFVTQRDQRITDARQATGQDGIDWARLAGNVLNPINAVGAIPRAVTVGGRALVGALTGAGGAAVQPVADAETRGYAGPKIAEMGIGAGVGAVAAPVIGKLGDAITTRISNAMQRGERAANAPALAEQMVRDALAETGQRMDDYPADVLAKIKADVTASLVAGKNLDAAQLARMADFERLGIKPVSGQVTRDASEFSNQYNLARSGGVGEPIRQRLVEQNRQLTEQIGGFGAREAKDATQAGEVVSGAAAEWYDRTGKAVSKAYDVARNSAGRDADVPVEGLAREYARLVYEFGEENIPGAIKARAREFGFATPGGDTPAKTALQDATVFARIKGNIPGAQEAVQSEAEALAAMNAAKSSYVSALQEIGKMQALGARSQSLADSWTPVPGMPRVPGRYGPTVDLVEQSGVAARDVEVIMRQRQAELRAAEQAYEAAQQASARATRGMPREIVDQIRNGDDVLGSVKPLTVNDSELLLKMTNSLKGSDPTKNAVLAKFNQAVKDAVKQMDGDGGPFALPRSLAAKRFEIMDAIPALEAAAKGDVPADTFVQKFIVGNRDSKQVINLANILKSRSPEALQEARNQLGAHLHRAAFGENLAGDAAPAPERFAKALRDIGDAKLSAFYTPEQIADLKALSRVVAYINKLPAANSANTSNSTNRLLDVAQQIPGLSAISPYAGAALRGLSAVSNAASRGREVQAAMNPTVQATAAELPPAAAQLRDLLTAAIAGGSAAGTAGAVAGRPPESRRQ